MATETLPAGLGYRRCQIGLLLASLLLRCLVALHPYSGAGKPPMYGDYEAQRHWMEITTALPVREWYRQGPDNDLQYWGLDYPPLTAFHSYLLGLVGRQVHPKAIELHTSRGIEDEQTKLFMRGSVIVSDLLIYLPGSWLAVEAVGVHAAPAMRLAVLGLLWLHPGLLLIDHGHFQYNGVCFGLCLAALGLVARGRILAASALFTSGLLFKQIALYYSPAFFFAILGLHLSSSLPLLRVAVTGMVVLATAALLFSPWLLGPDPVEAVSEVVHRMFPFERGLYEDKVSNFWCSVSIAIKLHRILSRPMLIRVTAVTTLLALVPGCLRCLSRPRSTGVFVAAVAISSLSFFLFSFQVHEKSVLFPAVAMALLPLASPSPWAAWQALHFTFLSLFSMYPLVVKDELYIAYVALLLLTVAMMEAFLASSASASPAMRWVWGLTVAAVALLHGVYGLLEPPQKYPDLLTMSITCSSCAGFIAHLAVLLAQQFRGFFDARVKAE